MLGTLDSFLSGDQGAEPDRVDGHTYCATAHPGDRQPSVDAQRGRVCFVKLDPKKYAEPDPRLPMAVHRSAALGAGYGNNTRWWTEPATRPVRMPSVRTH